MKTTRPPKAPTMKKIQYTIPPTANVGNCTIVGVSSLTETARENALWEYNSMRAHDGLPPVGTFPNGTKSKVLFFDGEEDGDESKV